MHNLNEYIEIDAENISTNVGDELINDVSNKWCCNERKSAGGILFPSLSMNSEVYLLKGTFAMHCFST